MQIYKTAWTWQNYLDFIIIYLSRKHEKDGAKTYGSIVRHDVRIMRLEVLQRLHRQGVIGEHIRRAPSRTTSNEHHADSEKWRQYCDRGY